MPSQLADLHITAQERLRALLAQIVTAIWMGLGSYDEDDVEPWLTTVVPLVLGAQRQAVALTEAFLSLSLGRPPLGVSVDEVVGKVRGDVTPDQVYHRPFVTVWSGLQERKPWEQAVAEGLDRATSAAVTDVALASRETFQVVQDADDGIFGYRRVADAGACAFCLVVNGAYVKQATASPLHNHCGCSLEPLTEPHPNAKWLPSGASVHDDFAVHEHGELGAVITAPDHAFTTEAEALG